jgi:hypothetical protein
MNHGYVKLFIVLIIISNFKLYQLIFNLSEQIPETF